MAQQPKADTLEGDRLRGNQCCPEMGRGERQTVTPAEATFKAEPDS